MDLIGDTLTQLFTPLHVLVCTVSLTSVKDIKNWELVQCLRLGCECHALGDSTYSFLFPLVLFWAFAAVVLTFAPKNSLSPLEIITLDKDDENEKSKESVPNTGHSRSEKSKSSSKNYICIECGTPVSSLYTEYSKGNIRLTQCENCQCFVDKYVEHDVIIIFIDIILFKSQVYRHLLVNKKNFRKTSLEKNVFKIAVLLVLFNVYISWFRLEEGGKARNQEKLIFGSQQHFILQYLFILFLCIIDFLVYILGIVAALIIHQRSFSQVERWTNIATAIIVSSFGKILMILLVIWDFKDPNYSLLLDFLTYTSHASALAVLFGLSTKWAFVIVMFGLSCRQLAVYYLINTSFKLFLLYK